MGWPKSKSPNCRNMDINAATIVHISVSTMKYTPPKAYRYSLHPRVTAISFRSLLSAFCYHYHICLIDAMILGLNRIPFGVL